MQSILNAAYDTVHDKRHGGAAGVAEFLGKRHGTMCAEVRPSEESTAKLGLLDAARIMDRFGDYRILNEMCRRLGFMAIQLPPEDEVEPATPLACVTNVSIRFAQLLATVSAAHADGQVTDNELAEVLRAWGELSVEFNRLLLGMQQINAAAKPAHLRAA